ncbi:facilitated trehalose transporter Tret1-like [Tropilaelaps mercedesae]|uniref:Facilitated trehalose transporter Tret1-like n=1 Tax=Tropilaelaps mercedesae TaxID=418985 RepID=A0A1V9XNJ2_9ACAR|nr:facilitated trehalose transporter Tret1-like [Tropilaelaps mercedesae]
MPELIDERSARQRYVHAALASYLGSMSIGMALGYSSPVGEYFEKKVHLNKSTFGSILTIGALAGGLIASLPAERFGRKTTILGTTVLFSIGWILILLQSNAVMCYVARFILGLASGIDCMVIPVYLGEVSTPERRGVLGTGHQFSIVLGVFIAYCLGSVIEPRSLTAACLVPVAATAAIMVFMPESPTWLVKSGKSNNQVMDALYFLFGQTVYADAQREVLVDAKGQESGDFTITDLVNPSVLKPLSLALSLMFLQQMSGINALIFYMKDIFASARTTLNENVEAIIIGGIQVAFTVPAAIVIDRAGRRLLLHVSCIVEVLGLALLILYYNNQELGHRLSFLPVTALSLYVAGFSVGYGPIPWLMMSELLPVRVRGFGTGLCTAFNWLCAFLVTQFFDSISKEVGNAGVFGIFLGIAAVGGVYVFLFLPETKGKTVEEIEAMFRDSRFDGSVATVESSYYDHMQIQ